MLRVTVDTNIDTPTRNTLDTSTRIEVWHCVCKFCKHEWTSKRGDKLPQQCSKCRRRKWDSNN